MDYFLWLLFLILAIAAGAIYVSIINDFTDLKYDIASKKRNGLERFNPNMQKLLLLASILLGVLFCFFFMNDVLSLIFYLAAYLSFSLYSISPFRFKNRGILGVIADASGAHLFPSFFVASSLMYKMHVPIDVYWLSIIGVWSFAYGLRGILWHQFWDRENDLSINHKTFATAMHESKMKLTEIIITGIEIIALLAILSTLGVLPFIALLFYVAILFGYKKLKIKTILIITDTNRWQIFMSDYYQILLPISLIIACSLKHPLCLVLLFFHLLCFPYTIKSFIKTLFQMMGIKKNSFFKNG
ncbi:UbiA family prenyltransferase [Hwangdonia lutea]|uniref:UbiA family prenyltransferase n=1 Tax=Hwangdonia lutea TaxID=3075823 RepID=A0AA97EQT4_9FLAO|nr:UbiA family prenyltransferase [Hwangdonia sp. SCSIO 19198]WOD45351.1 UbiA family prenyltransferase [Hwangdonia sp. SCSIO 19198]